MKTWITGLGVACISAITLQAARMENESVVFCSDLQTRSANLLFVPDNIESVRSANGARTFKEGVDYRLESNGRMVLTEKSSIPVLDYYGKAIDKKAYLFADSKGRPIFSPGGTQKHNNYDVVVTYSYTKGSLNDLMQGACQPGLTTALEKLKSKQPLNVTFFGDSITYGAQASSLAPGSPPNAPAYPMQVIEALKTSFGNPSIQYANLAVGGKTSAWGLEEIKKVVDTTPDLVVLAFGMNDASGKVPTEKYRANTEGMIHALRAANPAVSIILVAEFSPNPEWAGSQYPLREKNRAALEELHKKYANTAFVDVGMVSRRIADKKKFQDFSGNNLNHPNDFMHAIYAKLILQLFSTDAASGKTKRLPDNR